MNLLGPPASRRPVGSRNRNSPARRQRSQELFELLHLFHHEHFDGHVGGNQFEAELIQQGLLLMRRGWDLPTVHSISGQYGNFE